MLKLLSPSEFIVLRFIADVRFIADGNTNAEIGAKLFAPVAVIDDNMQSVFKKLKVRNCFQAAIKLALYMEKQKSKLI